MNSRDHILNRIRQQRPPDVPLPASPVTVPVEGSLLSEFCEVLTRIGGQVRIAPDLASIQQELDAAFRQPMQVVNGIPWLQPYNGPDYAQKKAGELENTDLLYLEGELGVAENGAVWLSEGAVVNRLLPFVCRELVLVLQERTLVADLHEAYKRIHTNKEGYGLFIAGPSKTADIEQSLVIGAHGPLALTVWIINETSDL
jgi:L-lactate dehydrogenase complex protein LldG